MGSSATPKSLNLIQFVSSPKANQFYFSITSATFPYFWNTASTVLLRLSYLDSTNPGLYLILSISRGITGNTKLVGLNTSFPTTKGELILLDNVLHVSNLPLECGIHCSIGNIATGFSESKYPPFYAMSLQIRLRMSLIPAEPHSAATSTTIPNHHPELWISLRHPGHGHIATFYPVACFPIPESCKPASLSGIFLNFYVHNAPQAEHVAPSAQHFHSVTIISIRGNSSNLSVELYGTSERHNSDMEWPIRLNSYLYRFGNLNRIHSDPLLSVRHAWNNSNSSLTPQYMFSKHNDEQIPSMPIFPMTSSIFPVLRPLSDSNQSRFLGLLSDFPFSILSISSPSPFPVSIINASLRQSSTPMSSLTTSQPDQLFNPFCAFAHPGIFVGISNVQQTWTVAPSFATADIAIYQRVFAPMGRDPRIRFEICFYAQCFSQSCGINFEELPYSSVVGSETNRLSFLLSAVARNQSTFLPSSSNPSILIHIHPSEEYVNSISSNYVFTIYQVLLRISRQAHDFRKSALGAFTFKFQRIPSVFQLPSSYGFPQALYARYGTTFICDFEFAAINHCSGPLETLRIISSSVPSFHYFPRCPLSGINLSRIHLSAIERLFWHSRCSQPVSTSIFSVDFPPTSADADYGNGLQVDDVSLDDAAIPYSPQEPAKKSSFLIRHLCRDHYAFSNLFSTLSSLSVFTIVNTLCILAFSIISFLSLISRILICGITLPVMFVRAMGCLQQRHISLTTSIFAAIAWMESNIMTPCFFTSYGLTPMSFPLHMASCLR